MWYTILLNGWSLEKDEVTGLYSYGTIPRAMFDSYHTVKHLLRKKVVPSVVKLPQYFSKMWAKFSCNYPKTAFTCAAAAATVGYFVGIGIAWGIAFKILKWIKFF
jgi:hypothetical protein